MTLLSPANFMASGYDLFSPPYQDLLSLFLVYLNLIHQLDQTLKQYFWSHYTPSFHIAPHHHVLRHAGQRHKFLEFLSILNKTLTKFIAEVVELCNYCIHHERSVLYSVSFLV